MSGSGGHSSDKQPLFDPLFRAHYDAVWRYCLRRLGPTDADDAAAEVFAVAWRRLDDMPADERSRAWLYGVAYRVVGKGYRSRRRQRHLARRLEATAVPGVDPDPAPPESRRVGLLLRALEGLSADDKEILRLSMWDDLNRGEIAYVLGIKENAVDQRLHRARTRLKARFDRLDNTPANNAPEEAPA
jgi:RNA polymerase sigma-70 factor, ECF subfamily